MGFNGILPGILMGFNDLMDYSVGFGHVIEAYWIGLRENLLKTHGFSDLLIVQFCDNVNYLPAFKKLVFMFDPVVNGGEW